MFSILCFMLLGSGSLPNPSQGAKVSWKIEGGIAVMAYSPGGELLATSGYREVKIWDIKQQKELASFRWTKEESIRALAFSPDGKTLAVGIPSGRTVKLLDVGTGKPHTTIREEEIYPESLAFSPDGALLAISTSGGARLWNLRKGEMDKHLHKKEFKDRPQDRPLVANAVVFSPNGKFLATGTGNKYSGTPNSQGPAELLVWDVGTGQMLANMDGIKLKVYEVYFSADGSMLFAHEASTLKAWELKKYRQVLAIKGYWNNVAYAPRGQYLACLGHEEVTLYDPENGKELLTIKPLGRDPRVNALKIAWISRAFLMT